MNATLELPSSMPPVNGQAHARAPSPPAGAAKGRSRQSLLQQPILLRGVPSVRDREIFRQVVICRRTKTDVARQFQLSQPRITQICCEVKQWMQEHTPRQTEEMEPPQWLNLAENLCRERLETQYALAMEAFEASRQPRQWGGRDQEGNRIEKLPDSKQRPQCALLNTALKATIELARLDGIWGSGDAWAGRNREKLDEFRQQGDAQWDAETAAHEAMLAGLQASEARQLSAAAAADEAKSLSTLEHRSAAAYDRLWKLPPPAAAAAEVPQPTSGASHAAAEPCSDGPERNLDSDDVADRLKEAYAPHSALPPSSAAQPRRVPLSNRQKAFRRERLREEFFAPLTELVPSAPPEPPRINGHAHSDDPCEGQLR
jgi:hypothetical protein